MGDGTGYKTKVERLPFFRRKDASFTESIKGDRGIERMHLWVARVVS